MTAFTFLLFSTQSHHNLLTQCFLLTFDNDRWETTFPIEATNAEAITFFAQHMPTEFEQDTHYLKLVSNGEDIDPVSHPTITGLGYCIDCCTQPGWAPRSTGRRRQYRWRGGGGTLSACGRRPRSEVHCFKEWCRYQLVKGK